MAEAPKKKQRRDRTHDPKPNSGWWGEPQRHRIAAHKNNSNGGLGAGVRAVERVIPTRRLGADIGHVISKVGRRSR